MNDKSYVKLLGLLSKFKKDEVEVISETAYFAKNQEYLSGELDEMNSGKSVFMEMNEAEQRIEKAIKKHEDSI